MLFSAGPMPLPDSLIDLALRPEDADEQLVLSRRLKEAAELVQVFSHETSAAALETVLMAAGGPAPKGSTVANNVATEILQQTEMLDQEVSRFMETHTLAQGQG